MADTTTTNYGLTKPEVGASEDTWGTKINTNLDTLDTTVDSIQGKSGAATLKHTDSAKLTTTATGIDVTGNATFQDNGKAIFGAGDDLQIYHDGSNSYIDEVGQGTLYVRADSATTIANPSNTLSARFRPSTSVSLYYNGSEKLATTSTGIDVTGTATMDGLTVNTGSYGAVGAGSGRMYGSSSHGLVIQGSGTTNDFLFLGSDGSDSFRIANNKDISFYEDTGTTAKLFWDASAESLGIGTSAPSRKLSVFDSVDAYNLELSQTGAYNSGNQSGIVFSAKYNSGGSVTDLASIRGGKENTTDGNFGGKLAFYTRANGGADTERMRIDSSGNLIMTAGGSIVAGGVNDLILNAGESGTPDIYLQSGGSTKVKIEGSNGNVGIGVTPSSGIQLKVGNSTNSSAVSQVTNGTVSVDLTASSSGKAFLEVGTNHPLVFATNATERMRIDSSGNLLVGTTSVGGRGVSFYGNGANAIYAKCTSTTNYWITRDGQGAGVGTIATIYSDTTPVGGITVTATSTAYFTSSDERLKENIADADDAGSKIDAIQVRQYDWKADGAHQDYGMIAQELQAVAPEAVSGDADSEDMMGVDYSKLVPMLVKEIQSLRNRVAQLEE